MSWISSRRRRSRSSSPTTWSRGRSTPSPGPPRRERPGTERSLSCPSSWPSGSAPRRAATTPSFDPPPHRPFPTHIAMSQELSQFLAQLKARDPSETEFHQAVTEVAKSVWPFIEKNPKYQKARILERLVEPERVILFRVNWADRNGEVQINRGYRVQ